MRQSEPTALDFPPHTTTQKLLAGAKVGHSIHIRRVAHHHITSGQGLLGAARAIQRMARTNADYQQFSRATATVTPS
jgi:hypothetical protein